MSADDPSPLPPCTSHPRIIGPRRGPRTGAIRTVCIEPPPSTDPDPLTRDVAVQGVLPLGDLGGILTSPAAGPTPIARDRHRSAYSDADLTQITRHICNGFVEVVYGNRAVSQLLRVTSERVYLDLSRRCAQEKGRRRMSATRVSHARLVRISIQRPSARAVEAFGHLRRGDDVHALAARFELRRDRWVCVALDMRS